MDTQNEEIVVIEPSNSLSSTIRDKAIEAIVGAVIMTAFGVVGSLVKQKLEQRKLAPKKTSPIVETTATEQN